MRNATKKFQLASLLIALGLLLGLSVVGCSEGYREGGDTPTPTPTPIPPVTGDPVINYSFKWLYDESPSANAGGSTLVDARVGHLNEDGTFEDAESDFKDILKIEDLPLSADGYRSFSITITSDISKVNCLMVRKCRNTGVEEQKIGVCSPEYIYQDELVFDENKTCDITESEDNIADDPVYELYNGEEKTNTFKVGDTITVKVSRFGKDVTDIYLPMLFSDDESCIERVDEGGTVSFKVVYDGELAETYCYLYNYDGRAYNYYNDYLGAKPICITVDNSSKIKVRLNYEGVSTEYSKMTYSLDGTNFTEAPAGAKEVSLGEYEPSDVINVSCRFLQDDGTLVASYNYDRSKTHTSFDENIGITITETELDELGGVNYDFSGVSGVTYEDVEYSLDGSEFIKATGTDFTVGPFPIGYKVCCTIHFLKDDIVIATYNENRDKTVEDEGEMGTYVTIEDADLD